MRGTLTLPDGYAGLCSIDLQKDKRLALLINGLALLIALPLVFLGNRIVPLRTLFSMDDGFGFYFLRLGMLTAGYAAYVVLHELVHGVCMKYFSGAPARSIGTGRWKALRRKRLTPRPAGRCVCAAHRGYMPMPSCRAPWLWACCVRWCWSRRPCMKARFWNGCSAMN